MNAATLPAPSQAGHVLSTAVVRACVLLGISQGTLARILGVSAATASRLANGQYRLDPAREKEWEFAVLFVRVFRSLDALVGHGENARNWLRGHNKALNARPIDLLVRAEGLVRVAHYLDAHRGRV